MSDWYLKGYGRKHFHFQDMIQVDSAECIAEAILKHLEVLWPIIHPGHDDDEGVVSSGAACA